MAIRKWIISMVVVIVMVGGAVALAQGTEDAPVPPADTELDESRFIGDPPGNEQTGEWQGDFEYGG
jgi:hypothetical protein